MADAPRRPELIALTILIGGLMLAGITRIVGLW